MNVILTMTTVPNRLEQVLNKSVSRILDMPEEFELHLNIPDVLSSTGERYIIPEWLSNIVSPKLKLFTGVKDLGPRTKIVPTLERVMDPDAIIITVDDDILYADGMVSYHIKMRNKYPEAAIGFAGVGDYARYYTAVKEDKAVDVLENYKTVSYKRSFFKNDFFKKYIDLLWNDDIIISGYLRDKKIEKYVVRYDPETYFGSRVISFPIVGLIPTEFGGCDHYRGGDSKNTFDELLRMYDSI